jgi:DNA-binding phage protein
MSERCLDLFETDALPPQARSKLYCLPLLDDGGGAQESLLNYVHRLAREHQLRVMDLLVKVVLPETSVTVHHGRFRFARSDSRTVNGYGKYAEELTSALKRLTLNDQLDRATFLPWRNLFDGKGAGLLHTTRKWCPDCVAEASESARPITSLLLWSCASVTHCHVHLCPLQDACAKCGASQFPLAESTAYGRCQACGATLGWRSGLLTTSRPDERQRFVLRSVLQMLEQEPQVSRSLADSQTLSHALRGVVDAHQFTSMQKLAKDLHLGHKVLHDWANMTRRPRFDTLLEVCYRLGTTPVELLSGESSQLTPALKPGSLPLKRPTHKLSAQQLKVIESEIEALTQHQNQYVNLAHFAAAHDTSVGHLMYRIPDACKRLLEHRTKVRELLAQQKLQRHLAIARSVARELCAARTQFPRRRLAEALHAAGTSIRNPVVRYAAYDEIERIRGEQAVRIFTSEPPNLEKDQIG